MVSPLLLIIVLSGIMIIQSVSNVLKGSILSTIFVSHVALYAHAKTLINTVMSAEALQLIGSSIFSFRHIGIMIDVDFVIHQFQIALLVIVLITVLHVLMVYIQLRKECVPMRPALRIVRSAKMIKHA